MKDLVNALRRGNQKAFEILYVEYTNKLVLHSTYLLRNRCDAEDIVSNFLINIFSEIHKYDETKSSFNTWIHTCIRNESLNFIKQNSRLTSLSEEEIEAIDNNAQNELFYDLRKVLTDFEYEIMCLKFKNDYTNKEIAKIMNVKEKRIKYTIEISYKKIRQYLKEVKYYE